MALTLSELHATPFDPPSDKRTALGYLRLGLGVASAGFKAHAILGLNDFDRFIGFYREVFSNEVADRLAEPPEPDSEGEGFSTDLWRFAILAARAGLSVERAVPYFKVLHSVDWLVLLSDQSIAAFYDLVEAAVPVEYLAEAVRYGVPLESVTHGWLMGAPLEYVAAAR